jgi:hypothetical protein
MSTALQVTAPQRSPGRWRFDPHDLGWKIYAPLLAIAVALVAMQLHWHGVDWPAQLYRVQVFRTSGWVSYDTGWYSGNVPAAYSSLYPPVAALFGLGFVAVASVAAAAWAFDRLVTVQFGPRARLGSLCFAAGMVVQVVIGQLPFLLGMALGLLALLALTTMRTRSAIVFAVACALSSFVAALFVILAAASIFASRRESRMAAAAVAAAALTPIMIVAVVYRQVGRFPFPAPTLASVLVACLGVALVIPASHRTLRLGVGLYAALSAVLFVLQTPVGANDARLATTMAVPLLLCAGRRRFVTALFVVVVGAWEIAPAMGAINIDTHDASTSQSFYRPLLDELRQVASQPTRLEIPLTHEHWEAAWVAPTIPLARGWERQLDISENPLFYKTGLLNRSTYRTWLVTNGVGWVALPHAPLDYAGRSEAALLRSGASFLMPVWHDRNWDLWKVQGTNGMVIGPATLTHLATDGFTLNATNAGRAVVRVRASPTWSIVDSNGSACLSRTSDSWTVVRIRRPGVIQVVAEPLPTTATAC